ncbi:Pentapeptide repeat-containing protein [Sulfitobacter marinus]|uniref:Pentapeptide repeat-containing protein n=1 Tax=Sulfitobacter marinus TaxID=394264 RepID=A0A1I6UK85_9RHOB|nr:ion channel [Sulfitobacter marinus]SFT01869.1 Pentapeptide repeat-containing protein [Sulfitobacter marinus]
MKEKMKRDPDEFFELNEPYLEIASPDAFWALAATRDKATLKDLLYRPEKLVSPKPPAKWMVRNKTFINVSFSKTQIQYIEFTDCNFEDCLFIGSIITDCRFNNCEFDWCNFFRAEFKNCYVDPKVFERCNDSVKHPNVGMSLYQELLNNSRQEGQPDFALEAQYQFKRWQRYLKWEQLKDSDAGFLKRGLLLAAIMKAKILEITTGSGTRLFNFSVTAASLLIFLTVINHTFAQCFGLMIDKEPVVDWSEAFYFSTIVVTSLGFGDITPTTVSGHVVIAFEAIVGFVTLATLVSMLFRKITS